MAKDSLPLFGEALKAGQNCVRASVRARDSQYRFLALTYRAYLESKRRPRIFQKMVESRLGRPATKPEEKRPFLLILHTLVGSEDDAPRNALPQFSKMVSALEVMEDAFHGVKPAPKVDDLIEFIKQAGGVGGLYDLSRVGGSSNGTVSPQAQEDNENVSKIKLNMLPKDIQLRLTGARATLVGKQYILRMTDYDPGEYIVRMRIGRGGIVEYLLEEGADKEKAA